MKLAKGRQQTKQNVTSYILQGLLRIVASDGCVTSIFEKTCPNYSWNIGGNVCEINPFIYDKWYGPIYQRLCKNPTANLQKVSSSSAFVPLKVVWDHPAGREDLMFRSKPFCNRFVVGLADWGSCVRGVNARLVGEGLQNRISSAVSAGTCRSLFLAYIGLFTLIRHWKTLYRNYILATTIWVPERHSLISFYGVNIIIMYATPRSYQPHQQSSCAI